MIEPMTEPPDATPELPLFPLQAVLFPDGLLSLRVFEPRYLDLVAACLREQQRFGVVGLQHGSEVLKARQNVALERVGVVAQLLDVDGEQAGILQLRCRGGERFEISTSRQQRDGLWLAQTAPLPDDEVVEPPAALQDTVRGLADAITTLANQGTDPFLEPHRFDSAGWVANRWCEILPIPLAAKQKLMALPDAVVRLELVDGYLRSKGVVG